MTDTGVGVSPEQAAELFQPFTQADTSTRRKFGGTGLGLVISRQIAKSLGGNLVLESSEPGKGSTFLITMLLPRGSASVQATTMMASSAAGCASSARSNRPQGRYGIERPGGFRRVFSFGG